MITALISILFLSVGLIIGWLGAERYIAHMSFIRHDFEELFEENPHPEIFKKDGSINRGDYLYMTIDNGFEFDDEDYEDIIED